MKTARQENNMETGLQIRSLVNKSGVLEVSLASVPTPEPGPDEIVIRVEATPINPSDIALLLGPVDMETAKQSGTAASPVLTAKILERAMPMMGARFDQSMPCGNEGAGTVVKAGSSPAVQALMGKLVAVKPWIIRKEDKPVSEGEYLQTPDELDEYKQYSMCINCMLCYAACPIYGLDPQFIGPAAIALGQRYNLDSRDEGSAERMDILAARGHLGMHVRR